MTDTTTSEQTATAETAPATNSVQRLKISNIKYINLYQTKMGNRYLYQVECELGPAWMWSEVKEEPVTVGEEYTFKVIDKAGKLTLNIQKEKVTGNYGWAKSQLTEEKAEKIAIRGEAMRCAIDLYAKGKITWAQIDKAADYFAGYISKNI
jgi:hypothetical protein